MRIRSGLLAAVALAAITGCATPDAAPKQTAAASTQTGTAVAYRRLTESQYRHAIRDTFGPAIAINARFEPERREEGLQAIGNARLSITTSGLEQYIAVARSVSDQVIDGKDRDTLIGCTPEKADAACAEAFIKTRGEQLFRRPVTAEEQARYAAIAADGAKAYGDFHKGLKLALTGMLVSPDFLFRIERAVPARGGMKLDAYSKASRLSYLLWDSGPDAALMEAARTGEINSSKGLEAQVDRMLASPRLSDGVRAFFTDMLQFEAFETLSKDGATYPKFSQAVADSAREETLRFLVDQLVTKNGDYRDIFTARDTYLDRNLAFVYNVPFISAEKWAPYTFKPESERSGILTQVTFLSLFAHPAASSPTIRGVKLNEIFLCLQIPQPPADVDFSKVQALEHGTVRVRLTDHMTNPGCIGCHALSDPPGLALERFDGLGQHRTMENGQLIDVSADIDGKKFHGSTGLGQRLHDDPEAAACLVRNVVAYGTGRAPDPAEAQALAKRTRDFASDGYRLNALFHGILTDPQFYSVKLPADRPRGLQSAALSVRTKDLSGASR